MSPSSCLRSTSTMCAPQFPTLQRAIYLNTGTYGLVPEPACKRNSGPLRRSIEGPGLRDRPRGDPGAGQATVAAILNAESTEIAITRNATDGNNLVLAGLAWQAGDEVISSDEEHPSLQHPLLYLQKTKGIKVHWVPITPDPEEMVARVAAVASQRTKLLAMSHVPCETGTRLPAKALSRWAAQQGVLSHFDGAQCVGALAVDVKEIGCDFYSLNGHKWICGPKGTGFFYARKERMVELIPAHVGAGSLQVADQATGAAEPWPDGRRFEFGTRGWSILAGFDATLDWFESLGWDNVLNHIAGLNAYLKEAVLSRSHSSS